MKIHTPPMTFKSNKVQLIWEKGVANNQDDYGNAVYRYASEWATAMEKLMQQGAKLVDIAKQTSHDIDDEGITGFMYGCAVSILADAWIHGEELRIWHNSKFGVGPDKKGTVNPAILTIG